MTPDLTPAAEVLLLILAAHGGEMSQDEARREWSRVMALTPAARAVWFERIRPLARAHARRHRADQSGEPG